MRFFSTLINVFAIVLLANAASVYKRAAANVESCVSNINTISSQIDILQPSIQSGGVIHTGFNYNNLQNAITAAQSSCCAINTAISDPDTNYFLTAVAIVTPKVQSILSVLAVKVSSYNIFTKPLVEVRIKDLNKLTNGLNTCLVIFTPQTKASILQGYIDKMDTAFTSTRAAYNM